MKIAYIDNLPHGRIATISKAVTKLAREVAAQGEISLVEVKLPTRGNLKPLYLSVEGQLLSPPLPSDFGQITADQVLDGTEIDALLSEPQDALFIVDVHFGDAEALQHYGIRLTRYLTRNRVRPEQIMLITAYDHLIARAGSNDSWNTTIRQQDLAGAAPEDKLYPTLLGMYFVIRARFQDKGNVLPATRAQLPSLGLSVTEGAVPLQRSAKQIGRPNIGSVEVMKLIASVAPGDTTVLLLGESGTGKEEAAKEIHAVSPRKNHPFVAVNCGAIPEALIESELFGHVKGAFTGAVNARVGKFKLADSGTMFLDEIGEISATAQVKLLRVLQEKMFEPVGGNNKISTDCRIIAATNCDLSAAVKDGKFREDLYYRLNVFPIVLPPLRDRRKDIPLFTAHFIDLFKARSTITDDALELLVNYSWPGNIRELMNVIERAVVLCNGHPITPDCLPLHIQDAPTTGVMLFANSPPAWGVAIQALRQRTKLSNERDALAKLLREIRNGTEAVTILRQVCLATCEEVTSSVRHFKTSDFQLFMVQVCGAFNDLPKCMQRRVDASRWADAFGLQPRGFNNWGTRGIAKAEKAKAHASLVQKLRDLMKGFGDA